MRIAKWLMAAVLAAAPVVGQAETLDCAINPGKEDNGWISEQYIFVIDAEKATVTVNDSSIAYYVQAPVAGILAKHTAKQVAMSWRFDVLSNTGKRFKMEFRATYFPPSGRMQLTAKPPTYYETYDAQGTCTAS